MVQTRRPIVFNTARRMDAVGMAIVPGRDWSRSLIYMPVVGSDRVLGYLWSKTTNARMRTANPSSVSWHGCGEHGVALENAPPLRRDTAPVEETEQRAPNSR
jgi:hypothetical protein